MYTQLHRLILMIDNLNLGDISLHPGSLEFVLLPLRKKVVDAVHQLALVHAVQSGDCLSSSINYNIAA
jgi:hypothetical protein